MVINSSISFVYIERKMSDSNLLSIPRVLVSSSFYLYYISISTALQYTLKNFYFCCIVIHRHLILIHYLIYFCLNQHGGLQNRQCWTVMYKEVTAIGQTFTLALKHLT